MRWLGDGFPFGVPSVETHGHSWFAAFGNTDRSFGIPERVAAILGAPLTNRAMSGSQAFGAAYFGGAAALTADNAIIPALTAGPYSSKGGLKMLFTGYNDGTIFGTGANGSLVAEHGIIANLAAIRGARYILAANMTRVGSWTALADASGNISMGQNMYYTVTNGDYVEFSTDASYRGEGITIMFPSINGTGGSQVAVRINPAAGNVLHGTYDQGADATALAAASGGSQQASGGLGGYRIPKGYLGNGVQTIRLVWSGLTGATYGIVTGAIIDGDAPVILPLLPHRVTIDTQMTWSNARNVAAAANFHNVHFVDLNPWLAPAWTTENTEYWYDGAHPNNWGARQVVRGILNKLPEVLTSDVVAEMQAPTAQGLVQDAKNVHRFGAAGTILAGDVVMPSGDGTVVACTVAAQANGVALNNAISGQSVDVAGPGSIVKAKKTATSVTQRGTVMAATTTSGALAAGTTAGTVIGKTLDSPGVATMCWIQMT